MSTVCNECGLPEELCVCDDIEDEETEPVTVEKTTRNGRHNITKIIGINNLPSDVNEDSLCTELKTRFGCGGSVEPESADRKGYILLQGHHAESVKRVLDNKNIEYQ